MNRWRDKMMRVEHVYTCTYMDMNVDIYKDIYGSFYRDCLLEEQVASHIVPLQEVITLDHAIEKTFVLMRGLDRFG